MIFSQRRRSLPQKNHCASAFPCLHLDCYTGFYPDLPVFFVKVQHIMRRLLFTAFFSVLAIGTSQAASTTETIIMLRHGEKPEQGLGQLNCQGLNRAIKLPAVLAAKFAKPDAIFAPNPAKTKEDKGVSYSYIRPLITVEPTAIKLGMSVNTQFGSKAIDDLQEALTKPAYKNATVLVAWEHKKITKLARNLLKENGGDKHVVPEWARDDFDSLYVVHITRDGKKVSSSFEKMNQGLNNQSKACPS
jgi:hypothetical protein